MAPSTSQIWSKAQSTDSLNNEMSPLSSHYSENIRNSSYFMSSGPQSMMLFNGPPPPPGSGSGPGGAQGASSSSGASSLPYISRSLSIDAYTQQQLEMGSKKSINSNRNSELEEYAKRYEAIGKRRGSASMRQNPAGGVSQTDRQQKLIWQRKHSVPEETDHHHVSSGSGFGIPYPVDHLTGNGLAGSSNGGAGRSTSSNASRSRSESVLSTSSSNETLRYNENDIGNSFDSNETVIQPPMEFFDNTSSAASSTGNESVDTKKFPLGTTYQNQLTQSSLEDSMQVHIVQK